MHPFDPQLWQIPPEKAILCSMSELIKPDTQLEKNHSETTGQTPAAPARWWLLALIAGLVIALDQTAKWLVTSRLTPGQSWDFIPALARVIRITYSYNSGAAFGMLGMLPQASDLFLLLALVTIIAFVISYPRLPSHAGLSRISIGLISGGALSNALDRLRLGKVVDYVHVQLTPTFSNISNFADHAITIGVVLLLLDQWLAERHHAADPTPEGQPAADNEAHPAS